LTAAAAVCAAARAAVRFVTVAVAAAKAVSSALTRFAAACVAVATGVFTSVIFQYSVLRVCDCET